MVDVWALKVGEDDKRLYLVFNETYIFISFPLRFKLSATPSSVTTTATSLGLVSSTLTSGRSRFVALVG